MASTGKLNIFFDNETVTTSELLGIVKLVNIALGLAYIDLIHRENKTEYESLKHSFYSYLYSRNKEVVKSIFGSFLPVHNLAEDDTVEKIVRLRNKLRHRLSEPDFREIIVLLESVYLEKLFKRYDYTERNLQRRVISELSKSYIFEKRQFNLNDFLEWLSIDSENRISEIAVKDRHEYEINFLFMWDTTNEALIKSQTLLTFHYIVGLLNKPQAMPGWKLVIPEVPDNLTSIVEQYNKVYIDIEQHVMRLILRKEE